MCPLLFLLALLSYLHVLPFLFTSTGAHTPGHTPKVKNVFRFKLDAKSVPEALETTILILLTFSIVLAHRQPRPPGGVPPRSPGRPPRVPMGTLGPLPPIGAHWALLFSIPTEGVIF